MEMLNEFTKDAAQGSKTLFRNSILSWDTLQSGEEGEFSTLKMMHT